MLELNVKMSIIQDTVAGPGTTICTMTTTGGTAPYVYSIFDDVSVRDTYAISGNKVVTTRAINVNEALNFAVQVVDQSDPQDSATSGLLMPIMQAAAQSRFSKANVIYKITNDINLYGKVLTIPSNCTLDFQGGKFIDGYIVGNNTTITSDYACLDYIIMSGTIKGPVYSSWWDIKNSNNITQTALLQSILNIDAKIIKINSNFNIINPNIILDGLKDKIIDFEGSFIKVDKSDYSGSTSISYNVIKLTKCNNIVIKNMKEQGDVLEHYEAGTTFTGNKLCKGIQITDNCSNITIQNCICNYNIGDGIEIVASNQSGIHINDIIVTDCICDYNRRQGYSIEAGNNIILNNCIARYTGKYLKENACGFNIEPWEATNVPQKITLTNCYAEYSENFDFMFITAVNNQEGEDIQLNKCTFGRVTIYNAKQLNIYNSTIYNDIKVYGNVYHDNPIQVVQSNIGLVYLQGVSNTNFVECNIYNNNPTSTLPAVGIYSSVTTTTSFKKCSIANIEGSTARLLRSSNDNFENITVNFDDCLFNEGTVYKEGESNLFIYFTRVGIHNCIFNIKNKLNFYGCLDISCKNNKFYNKGSGDSLVLIRGVDYADNSKLKKYSFVNNYFEGNYYLYDINFDTQVDDALEIIQLINTSLYNLYKLTACSGRSIIITNDTVCRIYRNVVTYDISLLDTYNKQTGIQYFNTELNKPVYWDGTNWLNADGYKSSYKRKGPTSERPTLDSTDVGYQYYDTTLNKYICWNGTAWVNMDGSALA